MKVKPISSPIQGEQILAISPDLRPDGVGGWQRRLNLYTGRSLSDIALQTEQTHRSGRLATLGQLFSAGVVTGLEVGLERIADAPVQLQISAGRGITASGEDVILPTAQTLRVRALPVNAPVALLENASSAADLAGAGTAVPRRVEPSLGELIEAEQADNLPRAGILVMQPIEVQLVGDRDPTDPCERDPRNDAFEDWQRTDGVRFVLYTWPTEWLSLPTPGDQWRNRLAYAIFAAEQENNLGQIMPWEAVGVPVALMGFDADWSPLFVDSYAVVRAGGRATRRSQLIPYSGNPFLWQARVQQFAEQLAESNLLTNPLAEVARQFRYLPPVGILPKQALNEDNQILFFPDAYAIQAAPIPLEQLDAVMQASASLQPFDLQESDQVQVLVPLPQVWYDPRLLQNVYEEPEVVAELEDFDTTIQEFVTRRGEWLQRRQNVREKAQALYLAIKGEPLTFPDPDPNALEPEEIGTGEIEEDSYGTALGTANPMPLIRTLREKLAPPGQSPPSPLAEELDQLNSRGLEGFITFLEAKVSRTNDKIDLDFLRVQTDIYRIRQLVLGNDAAFKLATSSAMSEIIKSSQSAVETQKAINTYFNTVRQSIPASQQTIAGVAAEPQLRTSSASSAPSSDLLMNLNLSRTLSTTNFAGSTFLSGSQISGAFVEPRVEAQPLRLQTETFAVAQPQSFTKNLLIGTGFVIDPSLVIEQSPIVGNVARTVTVAQRFETPPAIEAKNFTVAARIQTVLDLAELSRSTADPSFSLVNLGDISVPGIEGGTFGNLNEPDIQARLRDPGYQGDDEALHFAAGVTFIDNTVAALRAIEGRVQTYRLAIAACRNTLVELQKLLAQADSRLTAIANGLAEARHDVAVARTLFAEELSRLDAINQRRQQILRDQVPFLVFHRPRYIDPRLNIPVRTLNPGLVEDPLPACLGHGGEIPLDLRETLDLLREAPILWFIHIPPLLQKLDRLDLLFNTVQVAKQRAVLPPPKSTIQQVTFNQGLLGQAIAQTFTAQQKIVNQYRAQTAQFNLGLLTGQTWSQSRDRAQTLLSLGDLIDGKHGRSDLARQAARELDNLSRVAACLYTAFSNVQPAIRLDWAERLSQYDSPITLRNLASLPRWGDIPYLARQELQTLADWLYQRIDTKQPEAIALISDLIRICILLASHAPVNQIISGRVAKPTPAKQGTRIELTIDPSKIRIGMQAILYGSNNTIVAQGIVEDLSANQAAAKITQTFQANVQLAVNSRVEFR